MTCIFVFLNSDKQNILFSGSQFFASDISATNNVLMYRGNVIPKSSNAYYVVFVATFDSNISSIWMAHAINNSPYCFRLTPEPSGSGYSEVFFSESTGNLCVRIVGSQTSITCRVMQL